MCFYANLLNALTNTKIFTSKLEGKNILNQLGIDINSRAENLNIDDYAKIADKILK